MTPEAIIWNRAATKNGGISPLTGDQALSAMLLAHGLIMNGGVLHMRECLETDELNAACQAYLFFGLQKAAQVLEQSIAPSDQDEESLEAHLNQAYAEAISGDEVLYSCFEKHFAAHPDLYAPLSHED